jgi:hypothetical protein
MRVQVVAIVVAAALFAPLPARAATVDAGGGSIDGNLVFTPGLPLTDPCVKTDIVVNAQAQGAVVAASGLFYAGGIGIWGGGHSECERGLGGEGDLAGVVANGVNILGGTLFCPGLEGGYMHDALEARIRVHGNCAINGVGIGVVEISAAVMLVPTSPTEPYNGALFRGSFAAEVVTP